MNEAPANTLAELDPLLLFDCNPLQSPVALDELEKAFPEADEKTLLLMQRALEGDREAAVGLNEIYGRTVLKNHRQRWRDQVRNALMHGAMHLFRSFDALFKDELRTTMEGFHPTLGRALSGDAQARQNLCEHFSLEREPVDEFFSHWKSEQEAGTVDGQFDFAVMPTWVAEVQGLAVEKKRIIGARNDLGHQLQEKRELRGASSRLMKGLESLLTVTLPKARSTLLKKPQSSSVLPFLAHLNTAFHSGERGTRYQHLLETLQGWIQVHSASIASENEEQRQSAEQFVENGRLPVEGEQLNLRACKQLFELLTPGENAEFFNELEVVLEAERAWAEGELAKLDIEVQALQVQRDALDPLDILQSERRLYRQMYRYGVTSDIEALKELLFGEEKRLTQEQATKEVLDSFSASFLSQVASLSEGVREEAHTLFVRLLNGRMKSVLMSEAALAVPVSVCVEKLNKLAALLASFLKNPSYSAPAMSTEAMEQVFHECLNAILYPGYKLEFTMGVGGSEDAVNLRACSYVTPALEQMKAFVALGLRPPQLRVFNGEALAVAVNGMNAARLKDNADSLEALLSAYVSEFYPELEAFVRFEHPSLGEIEAGGLSETGAFLGELSPRHAELERCFREELHGETHAEFLNRLSDLLALAWSNWAPADRKKVNDLPTELQTSFHQLHSLQRVLNSLNFLSTRGAKHGGEMGGDRSLLYAAAHPLPSFFGNFREGSSTRKLREGPNAMMEVAGSGERHFQVVQGFCVNEMPPILGHYRPNTAYRSARRATPIEIDTHVGGTPPVYYSSGQGEMSLSDLKEADTWLSVLHTYRAAPDDSERGENGPRAVGDLEYLATLHGESYLDFVRNYVKGESLIPIETRETVPQLGASK